MANKVALLIGVSEYSESSGLRPLPSAEKDVWEMERVLKQLCEFSAEQIKVLTNPQQQEVNEAIYWLFADRQKDDLLLFYFSGHGIKDDTGRLYFSLPATCKNDRGELKDYTAVSATILHERVERSQSTCQVLVLDCCFSGAFAKDLTIKDDGSVDIPAQLGGKGRAIFTSSNSIEYSFQQDGLPLSVYTHFFVEGLETGAADLDGDGLISADEMHTYISDKVKQAAPAMTPQFFLSVERGHKIYFARSAKDDPSLQYRRTVEQWVNQGSFQFAKDRFSTPVRRALDLSIHKLEITAEIAKAIEAEVLKPLREHQRKLQQYEQTLKDTVENEGYPLNETVRRDLNDYQRLLGLQDKDVQEIEANVLPGASVDRSSLIAPQLPEPPSIPSKIDDFISGEDIDYSRLCDRLKAQDWKAADRETSKLMREIACEIAGRPIDRWLRVTDITSLPIQVLYTIDQLWLMYSNGKFGFSVQKQIWQNCGRPKAYGKNWDKFGDVIGWRKDGEWDRWQYSLNPSAAPYGHFPRDFAFHSTEMGTARGKQALPVSLKSKLLGRNFQTLPVLRNENVEMQEP